MIFPYKNWSQISQKKKKNTQALPTFIKYSCLISQNTLEEFEVDLLDLNSYREG